MRFIFVAPSDLLNPDTLACNGQISHSPPGETGRAQVGFPGKAHKFLQTKKAQVGLSWRPVETWANLESFPHG